MNTLSKIIFLGDSNTEGFGPVSPLETYPALIQEAFGDTVKVYNQGVTCACVMDLKWENHIMGLPYVRQDKYLEGLALAGDIYFINLGTNDANDGRDDDGLTPHPEHNLYDHIDQFETHYQQIIDAIEKVNPKAQIVCMTPIPIKECIWPKHQNDYLLPLIEAIKKCAHKNQLKVVKLYDFIKTQKMETLYQEDGLHLNQEGHKLLAAYLCEWIKHFI